MSDALLPSVNAALSTESGVPPLVNDQPHGSIMGNSGLVHREDTKRIATPGSSSHTPTPAADVRERVTNALIAHGHMNDHNPHGAHVTDVAADGSVTINPDVHAAVADCIVRLVTRVQAQ